jgi:CubicO group peptidase (beta-lactamase class C family)
MRGDGLGDGLTGVAAVRRHGSTLVQWAGGLADTGSSRVCTPDTRFQICSVSKQFTAAAVLLLADDERVALEDPVSRWINDSPAEWREITVHHLLTHTSGFGHWRDYPGLDPYQPVSPEQLVELMRTVPLLSRPGDRWSYSSPGYILLGWIVQRVSDQPFAAFLAERVFTPLGLRSTSAGDPPGGPRMAFGYNAGQPVPSFDMDTNTGTGNIWSTVDDLIRWDSALAAGDLLSARHRDSMLTVHATLSPDQMDTETQLRARGYGYGWAIGTVAGHRMFFHPGDNPGYLAFNGWLPDDDVQIALLANDEETVDRGRLLTELFEIAVGS